VIDSIRLLPLMSLVVPTTNVQCSLFLFNHLMADISAKVQPPTKNTNTTFLELGVISLLVNKPLVSTCLSLKCGPPGHSLMSRSRLGILGTIGANQPKV